MKDFEEKYNVNPADFCAKVPKLLNRVHSKGTDSPLEALNDDMFNTAAEKFLTEDQIGYVKALLELTSLRVKDNSELRTKLAKKENVFDTDEPFDTKILRKMYRIFT